MLVSGLGLHQKTPNDILVFLFLFEHYKLYNMLKYTYKVVESALCRVLPIDVEQRTCSIRVENIKSFPSHVTHATELIFVSLALNQTPVTLRPRTRS